MKYRAIALSLFLSTGLLTALSEGDAEVVTSAPEATKTVPSGGQQK